MDVSRFTDVSDVALKIELRMCYATPYSRRDLRLRDHYLPHHNPAIRKVLLTPRATKVLEESPGLMALLWHHARTTIRDLIRPACKVLFSPLN